MLPLTRIQFLSFAAAGALVALTAASSPARADELAQSLGPVGPNEPMLMTVGSKRVVAFYVPDVGHCVVNSVVWASDLGRHGRTVFRPHYRAVPLLTFVASSRARQAFHVSGSAGRGQDGAICEEPRRVLEGKFGQRLQVELNELIDALPDVIKLLPPTLARARPGLPFRR
jgi:hypothetical protein